MKTSSFDSGPRMIVADPLLIRRLLTLGLAVALLFACHWLLTVWSFGQTTLFVMVLVGVVVLAWTVFAGAAWWTVMPAAISFGGFFFFGFKIMLYEIGLLLALLPLALQRVIAHDPPIGRTPLPFTAYALLFYLTGHLLTSAYLMKLDGLKGMGHIVRVYVQGLWPLVFLLTFHRFGRTTVLRGAFWAMYGASLLRVLIGIVLYAVPAVLYIPGINFVFSATLLGVSDLRLSALLFGMMNLCQAGMVTSTARRALHVVLVLVSGGFTLLGSGRGAFLMFCALLLFYTILRRRPFLVGAWLALLVATAYLLNTYPEILYDLPHPVRRTLTVLVVDRPHLDVHEEVRPSDEWHRELAILAWKNWTRSLRSFFLGNRLYPFDPSFWWRSTTTQERLEIAAALGSYEAGLWTVTAVLGLVGVVLYAAVFRHLLRGLWSEVRHHSVRDYAHAFYFIALATSTLWLLFCWIAGHFPSQELMFAAIAHAAYEDERRQACPQ